MNINPSNFANFFPQIDTHVTASFVFHGKNYEIERFQISFNQGVDHKGQPQHEVKGGIMSVTITQTIEDTIYDWAKRANKPKDGKILFQSKTEGTVLEIAFSNANCIGLERSIDYQTGTSTTLLISPEKIVMNGVSHDNKWMS